ncbi:MAG: hypothetical protein RI977_1501 [Bacteroidota bacterium]
MDPNHQKYKPQIKIRSVDPSSEVVAMTVRHHSTYTLYGVYRIVLHLKKHGRGLI